MSKNKDLVPFLSLFGYGVTTKAIAKKFRNCKIYDDKFENKSRDRYGNLLLPSSEFKPKESEIEIPSPGISPSNPLIKKAKNLISEYDLFAVNMPFSIWISGTNGKTTTTQMLSHLLKDKSALCGGNIGTPIANLSTKAKIWILETSSFTLHYTKIAKPNIYLLLPIKEDHISWHGDFDSYEEAKLKPLKLMSEGEVAIIPKKYENYPTAAFKVVYENSNDLAKYFDIDISKIKFQDPFLLDALLAMSVTKILFDKVDYTLINSFKIDAHKIEEFRDKKNRIWIDDSKATNIDATIEAIKRYRDKKLYLILGGDDKGVDLTPLFEELKEYRVEIFAIGKNSEKIMKLSKKFNIKANLCNFLDKAVKEIKKQHSKNSIALLSPAAASLDQFSSYKERGEKFKEYVK